MSFADEPAGTSRSREALALCRSVNRAPQHERDELIERSLTLAEEAVDDGENDAVAHFAIFCAIGRQMQEEGPSAFSLWKIRRLRVEMDRTLELAPNYPAALIGKGGLLIKLPGMLGGDSEEGERLVRQGLALEPEMIEGHLEFSRLLNDLGRRDEAYGEALIAAKLAGHANDSVRAAEARQLAAEFEPASEKRTGDGK